MFCAVTLTTAALGLKSHLSYKVHFHSCHMENICILYFGLTALDIPQYIAINKNPIAFLHTIRLGLMVS